MKKSIVSIILLVCLLLIFVGCGGKKKLDPFDSEIFNVEENGVIFEYNRHIDSSSAYKNNSLEVNIKNEIAGSDDRSFIEYNIQNKKEMYGPGEKIVVNAKLPVEMNEKYELENSLIELEIPKVPYAKVNLNTLTYEDISSCLNKYLDEIKDSTINIEFAHVDTDETIWNYTKKFENSWFSIDDYTVEKAYMSNDLLYKYNHYVNGTVEDIFDLEGIEIYIKNDNIFSGMVRIAIPVKLDYKEQDQSYLNDIYASSYVPPSYSVRLYEVSISFPLAYNEDGELVISDDGKNEIEPEEFVDDLINYNSSFNNGFAPVIYNASSWFKAEEWTQITQ